VKDVLSADTAILQKAQSFISDSPNKTLNGLEAKWFKLCAVAPQRDHYRIYTLYEWTIFCLSQRRGAAEGKKFILKFLMREQAIRKKIVGDAR
jgi:hypothetical protein